jgi:hypothetical protein
VFNRLAMLGLQVTHGLLLIGQLFPKLIALGDERVDLGV